jgi:hypothetical protein
LNHGAIPVEQDHARRRGKAPFDIVKAHSVALDKGANRWMLSLRCYLKRDIAEYQHDKSGQNNQENGFSCGHRSILGRRALTSHFKSAEPTGS